MATNLTDQVREIASVTKAVANGDLTKTVDIGASGEIRELKMTVNSMVPLSLRFSRNDTNEFATGRATSSVCFRGHSCRSRGRNGRTARRNRQRRGSKRRMEDFDRQCQFDGHESYTTGQYFSEPLSSYAKPLGNRCDRSRTSLELSPKEISRARLWSKSRARCWTSRSVLHHTVPPSHADLISQRTVNNMVDSLRLFAAEVTRVAKEVGIDGQLGGQAYVYVSSLSL